MMQGMLNLLDGRDCSIFRYLDEMLQALMHMLQLVSLHFWSRLDQRGWLQQHPQLVFLGYGGSGNGPCQPVRLAGFFDQLLLTQALQYLPPDRATDIMVFA